MEEKQHHMEVPSAVVQKVADRNETTSDLFLRNSDTEQQSENGAQISTTTATATSKSSSLSSHASSSRQPPTKTHIFYYAWYRNKEHDGSFDHWDHKVLPHWTPSINDRYKNMNQPSNVAKNEIGADFYPKLGLYSSLDQATMRHHLTEIKNEAHINTIIVSYWGGRGDENISKEQAQAEHDYLHKLFSVAEELGVYIVFHLEPYKDRTASSALNDVRFLIDTYGGSSAFYRVRRSDLLPTVKDRTVSNANDDKHDPMVPLFYVYDSYLIRAQEWKTAVDQLIRAPVTDTDGETQRSYDSILIGLYTERFSSEQFFKSAGFDGFYTYFGATRFTFGSTPSNWASMREFAQKHNLVFIPSVAPGYIDVRIRPWNDANLRKRQNGKYYDDMWQSAIDSKASIVTVTSYNEWHEGTQIEPAIPAKYTSSVTGKVENYEDYQPNAPDFYLKKTAGWVDKFEKRAND